MYLCCETLDRKPLCDVWLPIPLLLNVCPIECWSRDLVIVMETSDGNPGISNNSEL